MSSQIRHFLDLVDIAPTELRGMIEAGRAMKQEPRHVAAGGPARFFGREALFQNRQNAVPQKGDRRIRCA